MTPEGLYYRITRSDPPAANDFRPSCKEKPDIYDCETCANCGISVYDTREGAAHTMTRFRGKLGKHIAEGRLAAEHGMVEKTGADGHHEWWVPEGIDPRPPFRVL